MSQLYVCMMKQKKFALLSLLLLSFCMSAWAQERTVSGKVSDASNNPLSNVSVQVKGSTTGTVSDAAGMFSIAVPGPSSILVFTYTGMQTQEVRVNDRTNINVQMTLASDSLGEVVVIGYGTARRSDLTGAVATV